MTLLKYEWRKLVRMPTLWAALALCVVFNCAQIPGIDPYREMFREARSAASELGQRVDEGFLEGLRRREPSARQVNLLQSAEGMTNVFETLDVQWLSDYYQGIVGASPLARKLTAWKYDLAEERADHLSRTGAAMDLYAGPVTTRVHQFLFGTLQRLVLAESAVLAMLSMLYLLGYEDTRRTTLSICSTRTGRKLWRHKIAAGLCAAALLYAILAGTALAGFFLVWDFSGIWSASVSGQFNTLSDLLIVRPFLTWGDFTVAGYLTAVLALGLLAVLALTLVAAVCGLLVRDAYLSALLLSVLCVSGLVAGGVLSDLNWWALYAAFTFNPVLIPLNVNAWFTESGLNAFVPWQETVGTAINLALLSAGTLLALRRFRRKDVLV